MDPKARAVEAAREVYAAACEALRLANVAYSVAEAEIAKARERANADLLAAKQRLADAIAEAKGIKLGDEWEWRGRRYSITGWRMGWTDRGVHLTGRLIRKDGSLSVLEQRLW